MIKYILSVIVLFSASIAHATNYKCPPLLDEMPRDAVAAKDFESWDFKEEEDEDHTLDMISIYSGHPKEQALLKPDNADAVKLRSQWQWKVGAHEKEYWMMCSYMTTRVTYVRRIDVASAKICSVTQDAITKMLTGIECK